MPSSKLAGIEHRSGHMRLRNAELDPAAGERGVDRVIVAINPKIWLLRHASHDPAVKIRQPVRQRPHLGALLQQPLSRDSSDRAMHPLVDPVTPAVELVLEVKMVREPTPRHEVGTHEPVRALKDPLRLRRQLRLIGRLRSELFV